MNRLVAVACVVLVAFARGERLQRAAVGLLDRCWDETLGATAPFPGAGYVDGLTSCLAAYALARRSCRAAVANLDAALASQRADGLVPRASNDATPALPLHAVAALQVFRGCGDRGLAADAAARHIPRLYRWHAFLRAAPRGRADGTTTLARAAAADTPWRPLDDASSLDDARYDAILARADVALRGLVDAVERRRMLAAAVLPAAAARDLDAWRASAVAGRVYRKFWDRVDGLAASRATVGGTDVAAPGGVADLAAIYAPGAVSGPEWRDRTVARVVSLTEVPSFACGAFPLPCAPCEDGAWPDGASAPASQKLTSR